MKIYAIQCPNCKDIIYSRARHDFHWCSCGDKGCFIDGGLDYVRVGYADGVHPKHIELDLDITAKEMYDD